MVLDVNLRTVLHSGHRRMSRHMRSVGMTAGSVQSSMGIGMGMCMECMGCMCMGMCGAGDVALVDVVNVNVRVVHALRHMYMDDGGRISVCMGMCMCWRQWVSMCMGMVSTICMYMCMCLSVVMYVALILHIDIDIGVVDGECMGRGRQAAGGKVRRHVVYGGWGSPRRT